MLYTYIAYANHIAYIHIVNIIASSDWLIDYMHAYIY
jgi:hypothetical protein